MERVVKIFSQTSYQFFGKVISAAATFLTLSLIARNYGEYGTGIVTLSLTFIAFFTLIVDFGTNGYVLPKLISENTQNEWRKLFGFRIVLGLILIALGNFIILIWPNQEILFKQFVLIGLFFSVFQALVFVTCNALFQTKHKYEYSTIAWVLGSIVIAIVIFLFSKNGQVLESVYGYIVGWIVMAVLSLYFARKFLRNITPLFDYKYFSEILKRTWPIGLTLILNTFYFRVDTFLLSHFKNIESVGVYNLSYSVFQFAITIPTFMMNTIYPFLITDFKNKDRFYKNLRIYSMIFILISVAGVLVTFVTSPLIISLLSGGMGFEDGARILNILALGFPAFFLSSLVLWILMVYKAYKQFLIVYFLGLLINIFLNLTFIPQYSYIASAYITGICEYLILLGLLIILFFQVKKR